MRVGSADLDKLAFAKLVGIEAYEALQLLEIRRQTAKLECIKRLLDKEGESGNKKPSGGRVLLNIFI